MHTEISLRFQGNLKEKIKCYEPVDFHDVGQSLKCNRCKSFGVFQREIFLGMKNICFEHHVTSYFAGAHLILRESLAGDSVNVIFNGNIPQQINSAAAGKQQYVFTQQKTKNKCKLNQLR